MNTRAFFDKHQKTKERTSAYIDGKKFNTQSGNKKEEVFLVRLLPRIPNKPTELNEGPFYDFYVHYGCGPDGAQSLVCLNRTAEEFKSNKQKCPACSKVRQILNHEDQYKAKTVERAKEQRAKNRILWAVYDLKAKKEVEFLEVSNEANNKVMKQFVDNEGEFIDLTMVNGCCLQITRTNSGRNSEYSWRSLQAEKFKINVKGQDGKNITASYKYPENAVIRLSPDDFKEIYESAFEVESDDVAVDQDVASSEDVVAGDDGDLSALGAALGSNAAKTKGNKREATPLDSSEPAEETSQETVDDAVSDIERELGVM